MKYTQLFSALLLSILLISCQSKKDAVSGVTIPELINRPHLIGPEAEMGHMLDLYTSAVAKIKSNPKDLESRLSLAEILMQEARISGEHGYYYPAALTVIDEVLEEHPDANARYRALLNKGSVLLSLHQFQEAKKIGEEALALNSHSANAYGVVIDANVETGQYEKAVEYADKMVSIRPDLRSYSRVSYLREIYGQVQGAIDAMKLAVAAGYPGTEQTEWARLTLGSLYERYGKADSALLQYELSLSYRPNYPFAIGAMASHFALQGNYHLADSLNQVAMNLIPEVSFFVHQAKWDKTRGYTDKVKSGSKTIISMMADDEKAGHKMGLELSKVYLDILEDPKMALEVVMKEYTTRPDNIDINKQLVEIYLTQGNSGKAQEHLIKAQRTGSQDPELKCLEGMLMLKSNRTAEASALIKAAFVANPYLDCSFCKEAREMTL
ncbi:MAG TPA: tetratricopeptide repeat protein [Saprospiraceae bacterium]|nr:tetratricopeptide repeat protein [Saprospiraceae bacterium]